MRRELPAWGRIYDVLGGTADEKWRDAGVHSVRGKLHGYDMEFDLANWSERLSWFLARYHDLALQQMLARVVQPGDCFVDIGANLGMLSLLASSRVGATGKVYAFEPNPVMVERLQRTIEHNRIGNIDIVNAAISDQSGDAELHVYGGHPGWGSLSDNGPVGYDATTSYEVQLQSGDDLLAGSDEQKTMVMKIDVEGHEVPVLRSLQKTLTSRWPLVICELVDEHLKRAGYSAAGLREQVEQHGYRAFVLEPIRKGLFGHDVQLTPLQQDETREVDVMFVPPEGPWHKRPGLLPL